MGQAKNRGTKEQRVIEGERIAKEKALARKLAEEKARAEYEASLTDEERAQRKKSRMLLAALLSFTPESVRVGKALKMLS